jgi:hypothetical protein
MGATKSDTGLDALELDPSIIESLPEPVLSELIGFIEYDSRLARRQDNVEQDERRLRERAAAGPVSYPNRPAFWGHNRVSSGST